MRSFRRPLPEHFASGPVGAVTGEARRIQAERRTCAELGHRGQKPGDAWGRGGQDPVSRCAVCILRAMVWVEDDCRRL